MFNAQLTTGGEFHPALKRCNLIIAKVALKKRTFYRMNRSIKMKKCEDRVDLFLFFAKLPIFFNSAYTKQIKQQ